MTPAVTDVCGHIYLQYASSLIIRFLRRQRVVSEDRSVAPEWPLLMAERHMSAGE